MMQASPLNLRRATVLLGRLLLGAVFIVAGYSKIFRPNFIPAPWFALKFSISTNLANFALQVKAFQLLSPGGVELVAHTLPFAELIIGLLLLIGWQTRIWAALATLLLAGFTCVVTRAFLLHMDINCGCFATPEPLNGFTVLRDGALTAAAVLVTLLAFQEARKAHPWTAPQAT